LNISPRQFTEAKSKEAKAKQRKAKKLGFKQLINKRGWPSSKLVCGCKLVVSVYVDVTNNGTCNLDVVMGFLM
jgi:hypothetical protein